MPPSAFNCRPETLSKSEHCTRGRSKQRRLFVANATDTICTSKTPSIKRSQEKPQRSVTFRPHVDVRLMLHLNDMTDDERKDVWFCHREYAAIKRGISFTVNIMQKGGYYSKIMLGGIDERHCIRGLEYRIRSGGRARKENKRRALRAVLEEQDSQTQDGFFDDNLIRRVFIEANIHCTASALIMGLEDEKEARLVYEEETECIVDSSDDDDSCSSEEWMDTCFL